MLFQNIDLFLIIVLDPTCMFITCMWEWIIIPLRIRRNWMLWGMRMGDKGVRETECRMEIIANRIIVPFVASTVTAALLPANPQWGPKRSWGWNVITYTDLTWPPVSLKFSINMYPLFYNFSPQLVSPLKPTSFLFMVFWGQHLKHGGNRISLQLKKKWIQTKTILYVGQRYGDDRSWFQIVTSFLGQQKWEAKINFLSLNQTISLIC